MGAVREFKEDADKKPDAFEAIDLKELVTKFREMRRISFMECVKGFLDNPIEKRFYEINYRLIHKKTMMKREEEMQWHSFIADLIKKNKFNKTKPSEILLLGLAYLHGIVTNHNYRQALDLFTKVKLVQENLAKEKPVAPAEPSLLIALNYLGLIHCNSNMLNDVPAGMDLLREAIAKGSVAAFSGLAFYSIVPAEKQRLYQQGADENITICCSSLAIILHNNNSIQQSYYYYAKAAVQGSCQSIYNLGYVFTHDQGQHTKSDINQNALFFRLSTLPDGKEHIRKILASNKDIFFVRYQLAMLENNTTDISKLANENPSEFLECMINSDDLWDEVKPFLQKAVVEKIERLILDGLRFLRETSFDANVASIQLDYFLPKGLTKTFINLEIKSHLSEHDKSEKLKADKIAKLEQQKAEEIERCRLERERFIESVSAYKKIQDAKIKAADAERKKDAWLYSQSESSDHAETELTTLRDRRVR